jgi:chromosome segregation ATPase
VLVAPAEPPQDDFSVLIRAIRKRLDTRRDLVSRDLPFDEDRMIQDESLLLDVVASLQADLARLRETHETLTQEQELTVKIVERQSQLREQAEAKLETLQQENERLTATIQIHEQIHEWRQDLYPSNVKAEAELVTLRESHETLQQERDKLRAALVGIIGADGRAELEQIEVGLRLMPVPAEDKARSIDGIHALLATLKE